MCKIDSVYHLARSCVPKGLNLYTSYLSGKRFPFHRRQSSLRMASGTKVMTPSEMLFLKSAAIVTTQSAELNLYVNRTTALDLTSYAARRYLQKRRYHSLLST